jgi:hypothetical protein
MNLSRAARSGAGMAVARGLVALRIEHVNVHAGGQAVVGNVETPGGWFAPKAKDQSHALAHAPGTTMPSTDTARGPVPVARDEERPMPDARRDVPGRPECLTDTIRNAGVRE